MNGIESSQVTIQEYRERIQRKTCSVKEFAEIIGVSYSKALRLSRVEDAPVMRIGRDKRIILSKVDEFLENHLGECL